MLDKDFERLNKLIAVVQDITEKYEMTTQDKKLINEFLDISIKLSQGV